MVNLTEAQRQIIEAPMGAALVTAGAGSGKTRVLTQRIYYLIRNLEIPQESILALTFTNKAGNEMKSRVEQLLKEPCRVFAGTFHSFCARFLYKNIDKLDGYTKDFSIYDTKDTRKAIKQVLTGDAPELNREDEGKLDSRIKKIEWYISHIKNENGKPEDYCDGATLYAVESYNAILRKNNALDFDDLLVKTLELLSKCPEVLLAMQNRFKYILVDEFQDTNQVQYEIVKKLAAVHKNIMVVGDEDQCIYTWRGASMDNFKKFQKDFGVKIYKLEENFRSSRNIVTLAGGLVEHNAGHIKKDLFSKLPDGEIAFKSFFSAREEAQYVVGTIIKEVGFKRSKFSDFAIMVRINAMSRLFEEQLRDSSVPYTVWGGLKFHDRAENKVVLNYLRVLLNPADDVALFEVLNFPRRGVGDSSVEKIKGLSENNSSFNVIQNIEKYAEHFTKKAVTGIKEFRDVYNRLQTIHDEFGFLELSNHLISEIELDKEYTSSKYDQERYRMQNVYELVEEIKEKIAHDPSLTLSMYLKGATLATDTDKPETDNQVIITTVHSAKGLEFENVFIVGLEDGMFPLKRSLDKAEELEEERRLLYVAITRACKKLHISCCGMRSTWGQEDSYQRPSRFLKEMGFECDLPEPISEYRRDFGSKEYSGYESSRIRGNVIIPKPDVIVAKNDTAETLGFKVGDGVRHEKFGIGEVLEIIDKNILKIKFYEMGIKMLSLAYAKLEKSE